MTDFEIQDYNIYDLKAGKKDQICPKCSHTRSSKNQKATCASADWERGLLTCHHCGEVTQLHTYKRMTDKVYIKPIENGKQDIDNRVADWFSTRGISLPTLQRARVTTEPGWIKFNYYINDELINIKYRNGKKNFRIEKGAELVWYNYDALLNYDSVIICEGEIDVLSYMEAGFNNAISVPNGANNFSFLDSSIDHFDNMEKIYLSVDNDEAGQKLQAELIRRLGAEKIYLADLAEAKDANEYLAIHGVDKLRSSIDAALPIPLENVKTLKDVHDEFIKAVEGGFQKGYTCGLSNMDDIFSILDHQFCVVTGIPSSGKSDFVDHYCMGLNKKYGWKTAYASPENFPIEFHAHKIFRKAFNGLPNREDVGTTHFKKTRDYVSDNFYFIDIPSYDLESVLKKGAELVKRKGIKVLVIDPYNKVKLKSALNDSINDYTNKYLNLVDQFARKYNCFVFVVAHPIKLQKKDDGTYACPSFYDVKGGGEFYDMSPNGLAVHRDYVNNTTMVKVLKVKFQFQGSNQAECHFTWNASSGLYEPHEGPAVDNMPWEPEN